MTTIKSMSRNTLMIMFLALISKLLGFIRNLVISGYFGAGMATDAYFVAELVPNVLFSGIYMSLSTTFLPIYTEKLTLSGKEDSSVFLNTILVVLIGIASVCAILGMILAPAIISAFAPGFNEATVKLAVSMLRILFPIIIIKSSIHIGKATLNSWGEFIIPALGGVPFNSIVIIGVVLLNGYFGIYSLAWATIIGLLSQLMIQLPALRGKVTFNFKVNLKDEALHRMLVLIGPVLIGVAIQQINAIVDKMLASSLAPGNISAVSYAKGITGLFTGIFISGIVTIIFPYFSKLVAKNRLKKLNDVCFEVIGWIIFIGLPVTLMMILLRKEIVALVFERGAFDQQAVELTAYAIGFYAIGIIGYGVREVLVRVFYAMKDTKSVMINGSLAIILNIVLNVILIKPLGVGGLGLATSISGMVSGLLLLNGMKRKIGVATSGLLWRDGYKIILSSSVMMGMLFMMKRSLMFSNVFLLIIVGGVGYLCCVRLLRVSQMKTLLFYLRRGLK